MQFSASSDAPALPPWLYQTWLVCICAGMLLFFTQVTAFFPVLPLYLTQQWGENAPVGWVVGAMAAGLLFFRPWIGILIDRWGRKPVLWMGLAIALIIMPLYIWVDQLHWLIGIRILHGISQAAVATASQTMLVDLVPPHRRTALLGYLAMANTIGFSFGPLIGAYLFATAGFGSVLLVSSGITLLGFTISLPLPWLKSPGHSSSSEAERSTSDFPWKTVMQFPIRDATFLFFISSFLHGGVVTFLPLLVENSAQFYSLHALMAVFVRFGLGRWGDRISRRWVVSVGLLCSGGALIGLSQWPELLIVWSMFYGLGFGALFPVLSAIVSLAAPAHQRGRVYGLFLAGFDSGMTLGGAGIQPLVGLLSLNSLFGLLGGVGCMISTVAYRRLARPIKGV